jgi:hypothetical protein
MKVVIPKFEGFHSAAVPLVGRLHFGRPVYRKQALIFAVSSG